MINMNLLLMPAIVPGLLGALIGIAAAIPSTFLVIRAIQKNKADKDTAKAKTILDEAKLEAKNLKKEAVLEAKEETLRITSECEQEVKNRRA